MNEFQNFLQNVADALKSLASVVESMACTAAESAKNFQANESCKQKESSKAEQAKSKRPSGEPRRKIIRTEKPVTAAETVYQIIRSKKSGIDTSDLMNETAYDEKKVRNIIYKLKKQKKIKTAKRGVYIAA
jgi:hypothetical protein